MEKVNKSLCFFQIELANFELFSSSPKDFSVLISDRFPSRDWIVVGQFTAKDEKSIQSFNLQQSEPVFTKYIKVEFHSHYGHEHYCPVSLFRVYGTSEFEVSTSVVRVSITCPTKKIAIVLRGDKYVLISCV